MRIPSEVTFAALLLTLAATVPFTAKPAAALTSLPVKTTVAVPFSGTFASNLEAISIKGTLHIETDVTLTRAAMFAKVRTNITDATAVGMKSGQKFVGLAAALQSCALPISDRGYNPVSLRLTPRY